MKLSVIVPVYNTEQYLPRCIDSILCQSFTDFELLLINDGSKDSSGTICDEYAEKDSRIRVFHKENGGASSARNLGLEKAKGTWITFIDSDDWIEEDYFQLAFEKNADLYVQNWSFAYGGIMEHYRPQFVDGSNYCSFMQENVHSDTFRTACCSFFKMKIICDNNIRFDIHHRLGEDTLFVMDYYRYARTIQIMDNSCYKYNRQENWESKYMMSWEEVEAYLGSFIDKYKMLPFESQKLLNFMFSFYYGRIKKDEKRIGLKWNSSEPVLCYKKTQLPSRGMRYRIKYYLSIVPSWIIYRFKT